MNRPTDHDRRAHVDLGPVDCLDRSRLARFCGDTRPAAQAGNAVTTAGVAVIPVTGVMTLHGIEIFGRTIGGTTARTRERIARALGDESVSQIVLNIDSPGGAVDGIPELAAFIREANEQKPVTAVANTLAASAAYWIATAAGELVVTPSGEVGSIGVYIHHENWAAFEEGLGVEHTFVHAGRNKTEANMFEPLSEEARAHLQARVDDVYAMFIADVMRGRGVTRSVASGEQFGEGRTYGAREAVRRGMADRVATLEETVARLTRPSGRPRRRASKFAFI
ncbi:S49 family peptidase [Marinicauda algicola]|uniref:S49 family peptidase n=1 Tax=Marinicauda algicola TaxID=2029849 RepID=A0A4S2GW76_9PROT|nr:S49 family peptidase [Marinicauda algicola]TGY87347.1 S49 family peptidase [Marinicauda algicola]